MKRLNLVLCGLACAASMAACTRARPASARPHVRVAAAADLNAALGEIITRFTAANAVDVSTAYGSSGTFFAQLSNGAPFDVYLSADVDYPNRLIERGLALKDSAFTYARGRLVIWSPASSKVSVQAGLQALADPAVQKIAIANPEHAPYGRAAVAALKNAGVYDQVKPRLVFGENVAQAMQFAQSGAADAGIIAMSLALAPKALESGRWVEVPPTLYPPIDQGGAILANAFDVEAARAFRAFLIGPEGRTILQTFGFGPPASPTPGGD